MVSVSSESILLKQRRLRQDLLLFLHALGVMLEAGYDLAYAWPQVWDGLAKSGVSRNEFKQGANEPISQMLVRFSEAYPNPAHRLWFSLLSELYHRGTSLGPALHAITEALEDEQERDWEAHTRGLPVKASLVLAIFFLIPALALVFLPLLTELGRAF